MNVRERRAERLRRPAAGRRILVCAVFGVSSSVAACVAKAPERLTCDDVSAPQAAEFSQLAALISATADKGCADGGCHDAKTEQQGLRLDTPSLIYEELTTRTDIVYAMLASGEMPAQGTLWDADDLRLFRSWYCNGALP